MKRFSVVSSFRRIARPGGGLHLGVSVSFPTSMVQYAEYCTRPSSREYTAVWIRFGLIAWEFRLELQLNRHRVTALAE